VGSTEGVSVKVIVEAGEDETSPDLVSENEAEVVARIDASAVLEKVSLSFVCVDEIEGEIVAEEEASRDDTADNEYVADDRGERLNDAEPVVDTLRLPEFETLRDTAPLREASDAELLAVLARVANEVGESLYERDARVDTEVDADTAPTVRVTLALALDRREGEPEAL
jgi:hypothetical protein